ncbi:hypothetical protein PR048_026038 [Dryococelus australis]|uniref:Uncharacterized protein n=1 Tax=Dryococelus australis TaxID=614101 RepID=A0ABQ9GK90_9NEOP|nr:hypothetical protein PR048_026038 [Dryococelus australis]
MKPLKFYKDLRFLIPYLNDKEERVTNISQSVVSVVSPVDNEEYSSLQHFTPSHISSDTQASCSTSSQHVRGQQPSGKVQSQVSTASVLQDDLARRERATASAPQQDDPSMEFSLNNTHTP